MVSGIMGCRGLHVWGVWSCNKKYILQTPSDRFGVGIGDRIQWNSGEKTQNRPVGHIKKG